MLGYTTCSLNSLKGGYVGIIYGTTIGFIKGDTRSLDHGSYGSLLGVGSKLAGRLVRMTR